MNELTLKFDYSYSLNEEFTAYILSQNGVIDVKIDKENDEIYVKYDSNLISLERLNYEIQFFLGVLNIPSLLAFNKHSKNKTSKYIMKLESVCCEYCIKNMIEELLLLDGIEKVNTNYNILDVFDKDNNILFYMEYNETLIDKKTILEIENKFNFNI